MTTTQLSPAPVIRVWDNSGNLAAGGLIYTYAAGTSTLQATYTDSTGSTTLPNPVVLNSRGEASIWLTQGQAYKYIVYDAIGNILYTEDQISSSGFSSSIGASLIGFLPTGIGAAATTVQAALDKLNQKLTGFFYASAGAKVNRINDRLFMGGASINDGNAWSSTPGAGGNQDYVSINIPQGPSTAVAQFAALSTIGAVGGIFGTRTSDGTGYQGEDSLAIQSVAVNDATAIPVIAEAGYFEAQRKSNAGITTTVEIDSVNQGSVVNFDPYTSLFGSNSGQTFGLNLGAGGARAGVSNCSSGINFIENGAAWNKGIVFYSSSLGSSNEAISFYTNCLLKWYTANNQTLATGVSATLGSAVINFTAGSFTPYVGQVVNFSDGNATFQSTQYVVSIQSSTQITLGFTALKNSSGLTMTGLVSQPTSVVQSTDTSSNQNSIVFTNSGIMLGYCPATNSGLSSAGALLVSGVGGATNYVLVSGSSGSAPQISTNSSNLFVSAATGSVLIGNTATTPALEATVSSIFIKPTVTTPSGGSGNVALIFGSTPGFGIYIGSGAPTVSAGQGSLYMRSDGSSTSTRLYINTNGSTTWTNVTTAA